MGLLDSLFDPQSPGQAARLQAAFSLLGQQGIGNAGMAGIQASQQFRQLQAEQERRKMLDQLTRYQLDAAGRENQIAALPQQFAQPARIAPEMDARDIGTPGAAPTIPAAFDTQGYLAALRGMDPLRAHQLEAAMQKDNSPIPVPKDTVLLDRNTRLPIYSNVQPQKEDEQIARLKAIYGDGTPAFKAAMERLGVKMTTHTPPVSLNNYGSPLPIDLGGGRTGYIQPPTRPGGPSQILTAPGTTTPVTKPVDPNVKDLTEAQAKATAFLGQMRSASEALRAIGADQTTLSTQAETALAGGPMNAIIGQKAQRIRQSQDQWSEAFLRFKTGAASTEEEVRRNNRTFFPQIGDKPEQIAQKAAARAQAERDMEIAAGRGTRQLNERDAGGLPDVSAIDAELKRRGLK